MSGHQALHTLWVRFLATFPILTFVAITVYAQPPLLTLPVPTAASPIKAKDEKDKDEKDKEDKDDKKDPEKDKSGKNDKKEKKEEKKNEPISMEGKVYDLATLCSLALQRNTEVAAARTSLEAAIAGQQGVEKIRVPTFLQPDLPIRKKQAAVGVSAAEAGVRQAELAAVFGVQYSYVSALYAMQQEQVARAATPRLNQLIKDLKAALKKADEDAKKKDAKDDKLPFSTDLRDTDIQLLEAAAYIAQARLTEAVTGRERALGALREAAGLSCQEPIALPHRRLLDRTLDLNREILTQLALNNRPELLQATLNIQVCELEVAAQQSRRGALNVRTFASGADLHSAPVPAGRYDVEYRPGVIGAEMPPFLAGKQCDRVARASAYATRAVAVRDRAQGLITLEVLQAFQRYKENAEKVVLLTKAAGVLDKASDTLIERMKKAAYGDGSKAILDDLLKNTQVAAQTRVQANEALYQYLIALITLERATGAAFQAELATAGEVTAE